MVLIYNLIATEAEAQIRRVPVSVRIISAGTISVIWIIAPTGSVTIIAGIRIAVAQAVIAEPGISRVRIPGTTSPVTAASRVIRAPCIAPMAARKHRMTVATATAHTKTSVPALHMPGRGMSGSMPTMPTAISAVTTAMSATSERVSSR